VCVQIAKAMAPAVVTRLDTTHPDAAFRRRVSQAERAGRTPVIPTTIAAAA
jgi:hypothetical protein